MAATAAARRPEGQPAWRCGKPGGRLGRRLGACGGGASSSGASRPLCSRARIGGGVLCEGKDEGSEGPVARRPARHGRRAAPGPSAPPPRSWPGGGGVGFRLARRDLARRARTLFWWSAELVPAPVSWPRAGAAAGWWSGDRRPRPADRGPSPTGPASTSGCRFCAARPVGPGAGRVSLRSGPGSSGRTTSAAVAQPADHADGVEDAKRALLDDVGQHPASVEQTEERRHLAGLQAAQLRHRFSGRRVERARRAEVPGRVAKSRRKRSHSSRISCADR